MPYICMVCSNQYAGGLYKVLADSSKNFYTYTYTNAYFVFARPL